MMYGLGARLLFVVFLLEALCRKANFKLNVLINQNLAVHLLGMIGEDMTPGRFGITLVIFCHKFYHIHCLKRLVFANSILCIHFIRFVPGSNLS